MSQPTPTHATLDDWIASDAIPFAMDAPDVFNAAVHRLVDHLGAAVELLALGEALHGSHHLLVLRNRLFQRLVEAHGYTAIAVESSFPKARVVNEYATGRGPSSFDAVQETGFSHGFGRIAANRELVEWMRAFNARESNRAQLRFYGHDSPTEMTRTDSPRELLCFVLDYLASADGSDAGARRQRMEGLLGQDGDWENPAAMMDPVKSVGLSPAAVNLRIETEDLIAELGLRRPELVAATGEARYLEAAQYARLARQLLNYHAALGRASDDRVARLLGIRDLMMADNLAYAVSRERGRGKVLAFAHNTHLQRGTAHWQLGPNACTWWPAGSHVAQILGAAYAVLGSAVGTSQTSGIGQPEDGTLEARLMAAPGPGRFIPTYGGQGIPASALAGVPTRAGSTTNPTYLALTARSVTDFDALVLLDSAS